MISPETEPQVRRPCNRLFLLWILSRRCNNTRPSSLNCLNPVRERSGCSQQGRTRPVVQPQQQPHHGSPGQQLPGEYFQHRSLWKERERERDGGQISVLIGSHPLADSWTNWPSEFKVNASRSREGESEAVESHCATTHSWDQKIDLAVTVSAHFSPPRIWLALWALNMCLQREFSWARVSLPPLRRRWQTYMGHHHEERRARVVLSGWKEVSPLCFLSLRLLIIPERREKKIVFLCEYQANMGFPWIYNLLRQFFF